MPEIILGCSIIIVIALVGAMIIASRDRERQKYNRKFYVKKGK